MTPWAGEALRAGAVGVLILGTFAAAELWRRRRNAPTEWTRKTVHIGGGLVAMSFPWIFRSAWTVLALGVVFGGIIWGTRRLGLLGSVHAVERRSEGGIWYPIAIVLLFFVGFGQPVFYLISLGALVLSDALAALVGEAYGRTPYEVEEDRRTVEGSAVFFLVTFFAAHLPLLLLTDVTRGAAVLIAVQIALLVTLFEAISVRGNDNLIVPLITFFLLIKMTPRPAAFIGEQLVAQLVIIGGVALLAARTRMLTAAGAVAASLFFYGAWSLGGAEWTVAPAAALLVFAAIHGRSSPAQPNPRYQVGAVFYAAIVAGGLYVANNVFETLVPGSPLRGGDPFYPLYLGTLAAHLAMYALVYRAGTPWARRFGATAVLRALLLGFGTVVPLGLLVAVRGTWLFDAVAAGALCLLGVAVYLVACRAWRGPECRPWDYRMQAASAALAVAALLPPYLLLRKLDFVFSVVPG